MTSANGALREALFWMNSGREQLAATELALERMWTLVNESVRLDGFDCREDIDLMVDEVRRVRDRLDYWTGVVDHLTTAARSRRMKGLETVTAFVSPAGRSLSELDPLPQSPTEDLASSQPGAGKEPWRPSTPTPAEYWIAFYDELVTYQSEMLAKMADLTKNVSDPEARALEINDLGPLRDLIADGRRRAEVWRQVADSGEFFGSTEMGITAK